MKILCIGQSAYDITLSVDKYPLENKKVKIINSKVECGGGSANNAAYMLSKWGNEVAFITCVGNDIYGEKIKKELIDANVCLSYIQEFDEIETTTSYIINNKKTGTRTIITNKSNEMEYDLQSEIDFKPEIIFLDGNNVAIAKKVIKENPQALSILDAGGLKEGTLELCNYVDYIVCSNDFAKDYSKINFKYDDLKAIKNAYDCLKKKFKGQVVITLEEYGCFTKIEDRYVLIPSIKQKAVDTTGAGDIFHAAFAHFIGNHYSLRDTMFLSNVAGSLSVTKIGSKNSIPNLEDVLKYVNR